MERFKNFHFRGQAENEKIIKVIRRHWFNIFQQYIMVLVFLFFLISSFWTIPEYYDLSNPQMLNLFLFGESLLFLMAWIFSFILWIDFYFDVWIITDKRIVDIEQKALFVRHVSELKFAKIQDVSIEVSGLIPTMLNYGDVHIQTAGSKTRFVFQKVPDPYKLKSLIMNMQAFTHVHVENITPENLSPFTEE
ncbi:MAG: PH domain-containing protein [Candidatus Moranbacteria bacterium]|nr:PH domain-containing protein [Candidatus Moranbacteria bacterium]